jgi:ATP-binding cassette subfamily B protein
MSTQSPAAGFGEEARLILYRAAQVWHLVPRIHKKSLGSAALVMALTSATGTAVALLLGALVDAVNTAKLDPGDINTLYRRALLFLSLIAGAYVLRESLNVLRRNLVERTCTRINRDMSIRLVSHLIRSDIGTVTHDKIGALHGRIFRSVDGFVKFLRVGFLDFLPAVLTGLFALGAALSKQPVLGLVMVGVIPMAVWVTVRQLISQKGVRLKLMRDCEEIDGTVVEQLSGLEYIRASHTEKQEIRRLADSTEKRRRREVRHHFQMSLFGCAKALNEGFFHIVVLALAIYLAIQGKVSPGDVLTFSVLFLNVMTPLTEIHRVLDEGHEASLRVGDLLEMLAQPLDRSFEAHHKSEPYLACGEPVVDVADLVVEYVAPHGKLVRALDGLSLTIRHGETIGVAGRSGCGKSTWIKVLLRLTHPHSGTVRLGSVPMAEVSREAIGRIIGYVGQYPFVFAGTIAENIAYGNPHAARDDIVRAARLAAIHDEIEQTPGGYDAAVTERGQNLSGGQRQRLAIARVLLKQPPILILDEATSALDNISERLVQRALGVRDPNRTTVLVAHRLTTLRDADRIFVFDEGRIAEVGTYDQLLHHGGIFTELVMSAEKGVEASVEQPSAPPAQPAAVEAPPVEAACPAPEPQPVAAVPETA